MLTPVQVAVLAVRSWPVAPDLIAIGMVAASQLQATSVHVPDVEQPTSQQPWELMQHMGWLDLHSAGLPQLSSGAHDSASRQGLQAGFAHGQPSLEPLAAAISPSGIAAPVAALPSPASEGSVMELHRLQPAWPVTMDDQGRVASRSAALTAAVELQPPNTGSEQQTPLLAGSPSQPWYLQSGAQDGFWDGQDPADHAQPTAAAFPVQRLGLALQPGGGILKPVSAVAQPNGLQGQHPGAGLSMTSRDLARCAMNPGGLLDLNESALLSLMTNALQNITGPVAHGDLGTVALAKDPTLQRAEHAGPS